jgi:hypothetical protein
MDRRESLLAARGVSKALGMPFVLPRYATIESVTIEDEKVGVVLTIFEVTETKRELRFRKRGTRLMHWTLDCTGEYESGWKYDSLTFWHDDFTPYTELVLGRVETPKEYYERRVWEGNVYRPGSDKTPLDSAARVTEGYTTESMTKYWN